MSIIRDDLADLEQYVNDRRRSSPPPEIPSALIPETSPIHPMLWAVLPASEVKILTDHDDGNFPPYADGLRGEQGRVVYFPIHPLQLDAYRGKTIIESGKARISASYRTVFYEPDHHGTVKLGPPPGHRLMLKLHLDKPLPRIQGDRRLTPEIVRKCIALSRELFALREAGKLSSYLTVVPEEIGLLHENRGAIVRRLPVSHLVPVFSLSSLDRNNPNREILAATILRTAQKSTGAKATQLFGEIFAKPLIDSLLSAFRQGFSLEMHMQNVLLRFEDSGRVSEVFYRDLEGVVFSKEFRRSQGLPDLFPGDNNPELHGHASLFRRFFNRNLDHDLGRIFENIIVALEREKFFRPVEARLAIKSVQKAVREAICRFGFEKWGFWPRWFRFARTPYGNGTRTSHYYRCRFR